MKVAIGNDHTALEVKKAVIDYLGSKNIEYIDCGTNTTDSADYSDFAEKACLEVLGRRADLAILICGTGIGISISANKIPGIRAACCSDTYSAKYTRLHNDANALCFGARVVGTGLAVELVEVFLNTEFEGGRHARRVEKISALEKKYKTKE